MLVKLVTLVIVFLWGGSALARSQEPEIKIDSSIVMVPVQVMDRNGRYITSMDRSHFYVSENGIPQEIVQFESTSTPTSVFILLDVSGSMGFDMATLADYASEFVKELRPTDRIWVASFAEKFNLLVENKQVSEFSKRGQIKLEVDGRPFVTMVYDAVDRALRTFRKVNGRKAIILLSDGIGSGLGATFKSNIFDAQEGGALVYTVRFDTNVPERSKYEPQARYEQRMADAKLAVNYMRSLADATGGRAIEVDSSLRINAVFKFIMEELSQAYVIGYQPKNPGSKGERRQIKVLTSRQGLVVKAKPEVAY